MTVADQEVAGPVEFDGWVTARAPALLRFAYLLTGSREAAEDALKAALSKTYERWSRVSVMHDRDAYVRRLIINDRISWWRKLARQKLPVDNAWGEAVSPDGAGLSLPGAGAVWRLCQSLPTKQRAAVVLRFYEGLSYPEIADLLRCPEPVVRSHVHRALTGLQELIEGHQARNV